MIRMKTNKQLPEAKQQGFAAIVVSITIVIVLSLLTVGFAQLMRHELDQVTNRQLGNQAYYAAESGVNDAVKALTNGYVQHKTTCGVDNSGAAGAQYLTDQNVGSSGPATGAAVEWSCLLIDPAPFSLQFDSISTTTPTNMIAIGTNVAEAPGPSIPISSLTISWQDADDGVRTFRGQSGNSAGPFPLATQWGSVGMLRIGLASIDPYLGAGCAIGDCRANIQAGTYTAFLYPNGPTGSAANTVVFTPSNTSSGQIVDGNCNTTKGPRYCSVTISNINANTVLISLRSIYSATNVTITAKSGGSAIRLSGAQSLIDSTGKALDVVKRIQVRLPDKPDFAFPGFDADATGSLCKQIQAYPGSANGCGYASP